MKKLLLVSLVLLLAATAGAGVVYDCNTGVIAEFTDVVAPGLVVTAVRSSGFAATELPAGPFTAIWVYTGSAPAAVVGDIVDVSAQYKEYYDLSELSVGDAVAGSVTIVGSTTAPIIPLTAAELMVDPEAYESHAIQITDGMAVCSAPNSYGEWTVSTLGSCIDIMMDDYWYDDTTVALCDCYDWAIGMWTYAYGAWRLEPFVDGIAKVDCTVDNDSMTFGQMKSLFR